MSKLCCLNQWELLKSLTVSVEILLCRGVSCGIYLREGKECRCHLCACVCAHWSDFEGLSMHQETGEIRYLGMEIGGLPGNIGSKSAKSFNK